LTAQVTSATRHRGLTAAKRRRRRTRLSARPVARAERDKNSGQSRRLRCLLETSARGSDRGGGATGSRYLPALPVRRSPRTRLSLSDTTPLTRRPSAFDSPWRRLRSGNFLRVWTTSPPLVQDRRPPGRGSRSCRTPASRPRKSLVVGCTCTSTSEYRRRHRPEDQKSGRALSAGDAFRSPSPSLLHQR